MGDNIHIDENISLKPYNTFGVDVKAEFFVSIKHVNDLVSFFRNMEFKNNQFIILGGGSNILFTKDYEGYVVKVDIPGITKLKENNQHVWLRVGAGENWHKFVLYCVEKNYGGIENLSLIPGTMGAAPMQNIGAYGVEIKEVFKELEAFKIDSGELVTFNRRQCRFGYRDSIFKNKAKDKYIITNVTLRLNKEHDVNLSYGTVKETLQEMGVQDPGIRDVSNAVIKIRSNKLPDPEKIGNAGSFFKNPVIDNIDFEGLRAEFLNIPGYHLDGGKVKVPAAWLIDQCGWKGKRFGNIGVHKKQALVLVNHGGGTGTEIYDLAMKIKESVSKKFGIILTPEVNII